MRGLLRAEGVDFATTLFDTNNLSTIRGASLALGQLGDGVSRGLVAAGALDIREEFSGASQCLFSFDLPQGTFSALEAKVRETLSAPGEIPFDRLSIMVDAIELKPDGQGQPQAEAILTARNRARQMQGFTTGPLPFSRERRTPDPLEGILPGSVPSRLPSDPILDAEDGDGAIAMLASSVASRRAYGRHMRAKFYESEIGGVARGIRVTNSLQDMVQDPPAGLPVSVAGKIAVIYADGNGFGDVRRGVGSRVFATALSNYRRAFLGQIIRWLMSAEDDPAFAIRDNRGRHAIRFETLVYGGDELTVVMPAWLAASFVEGFFAATAEWTIGGTRLTHAVGVAIANAKTPVRQLTAIAAEAADAAKDAGLRHEDSVTFEIFESLSPPDLGIDEPRADLYGVEGSASIASLLALPGRRFVDARRLIAALKGNAASEGFPRSQIYAALRAARKAGAALRSKEADFAVTDYLGAYATRAGRDRAIKPDNIRLPSFVPRGPALDLALVTALWDYTDALGDDKSELKDFVS